MGFKWLALGDSITEGAGASTPFIAYVPQTRERLKQLEKPNYLLNHGVAGLRSDEILNLFQRRLKRVDADLITIMCGTNDITQSITAATYKTNLSTLVDEIKYNKGSGQCKIVLLTIPWRNDANTATVPTFNTKVSEVATEKNVLLCDIYPAFSTAAYLSDAVHPNDSGHAAIKDILAPYINGLNLG